MVYPAANHTRFEHSLGVMHVATQMFDSIVEKRRDYLLNDLGFSDEGLKRDRTIIRLAALLHDVGHGPFSHAGEELMPTMGNDGKKYKHEHYSDAAVRFLMKDVIDNHPHSENLGIKAAEIADFITGSPVLGRKLIWRQLITGQLDADRTDYLLRDSYHIGVQYGKLDIARLICCLTIGLQSSGGNEEPVIAVERSGMHVAESLVLARYMMFTQVYFQHTRRAFDYHYGQVLKFLLTSRSQTELLQLSGPTFPPPTEPEIQNYLNWTDWTILGALDRGEAGPHGEHLVKRSHFRKVFELPEIQEMGDMKRFNDARSLLGSRVQFTDSARTSYYKLESTDINVQNQPGSTPTICEKLSNCVSTISPLVKYYANIQRIYVSLSDAANSKKTLSTNGLLS